MGRDFSKLLHQWARALRALGAARRLLLMSPIALTMVVTPVGARAGAPGGFLETTTSTQVPATHHASRHARSRFIHLS
jgi:hypothetical protein